MAIDTLAAFCINKDDLTFDRSLIGEDCQISFLLNDETSTQWFKDQYPLSKNIPQKTIIGTIQLWIRLVDNICEFEFWPLSGSVAKACMDSSEVKNHLISWVRKANGQSLDLDLGNGTYQPLLDHDGDPHSKQQVR